MFSLCACVCTGEIMISFIALTAHINPQTGTILSLWGRWNEHCLLWGKISTRHQTDLNYFRPLAQISNQDLHFHSNVSSKWQKHGKSVFFFKKPSAQFANSSAQGMMGNETGSREERVPMRQITLGRQTVSNGITWLWQTCQLECELHVSYENEEERLRTSRPKGVCALKKIPICSRQGHNDPEQQKFC